MCKVCHKKDNASRSVETCPSVVVYPDEGKMKKSPLMEPKLRNAMSPGESGRFFTVSTVFPVFPLPPSDF